MYELTVILILDSAVVVACPRRRNKPFHSTYNLWSTQIEPNLYNWQSGLAIYRFSANMKAHRKWRHKIFTATSHRHARSRVAFTYVTRYCDGRSLRNWKVFFMFEVRCDYRNAFDVSRKLEWMITYTDESYDIYILSAKRAISSIGDFATVSFLHLVFSTYDRSLTVA